MTARRSLLADAAFALIVLLPHLVGLRNGFVYDDFRFVVENPGIQTLARPLELLVDPTRASDPIDRDIWRPLRTLLFAAEHALFGHAAAGWHAVSLVLHGLLVFGVIALARRLPAMTGTRARFAGLLFGLHPLTVEAVAWVSSQGDLLAALFVVGALLSASRHPLAAAAMAALALLAKESALPLAAVLLVGAGVGREGVRRMGRVAALTVVVTGLYLLARQSILARDWSLTSGGFAQADAGPGSRAFQAGQSLLLALKLFLIPHPLGVDYNAADLAVPSAWHLGAALLLVGLAVGLVAGRRELRARLGFPLCFALLFLLPTSGLLVAMKSPLAERFLLLPTLGFSLAVASLAPFTGMAGASTWSAGGRGWWITAVAVLVLLAALTFRRTLDFHSDEHLWSRESNVHPGSIQARLGLLHVARARQDAAAMRNHGNAIIALTRPGDARRLSALTLLGELDLSRGATAEGLMAMAQCRQEVLARGDRDRVVALDPAVHLAFVAVGSARLAEVRGDARSPDSPLLVQACGDATAIFEEGIARFGRQAALLEGLGVVADLLGNPAAACKLFLEALAAERTTGAVPSASLRYHFALAELHRGGPAAARLLLDEALRIDSGHPGALRLRAQLSP